MSPGFHDYVARGPFGRLGAKLCFGGYALLGRLAPPLVRHYLKKRLAHGREDPQRLAERFGEASRARPPGPLLWIHAASVGEALSALPLIDRLQREWPCFAVLMTSGTVTSARLLEERLPEGVVHQYVPVDLPAAVARFLAHWRPDVGLFIESEFWPNLMRMSARQGVEMVLLNGRISSRSYRRWRRAPALIADLLSCFCLTLARSPEDQARLQALRAGNVVFCGDLKAAAAPLSADKEELAALKAALGERPRWLAASTHPGEDPIFGEIQLSLRERFPGLLTFLAPRHPHRAADIRGEMEDLGLTVAQRSHGEPLEAGTDIYLLDTIGEMGLWYRLVETVFVGGSLVPHGGHNLLEPTKLACAVLAGPHTTNFTQLTKEMTAAGALRPVGNAQELQAALTELQEDHAARQAMIAAAADYAAGKAGVLNRTLEALQPLLQRTLARY